MGSQRPRRTAISRAKTVMGGTECFRRLSWERFAALCRTLAARVAADYQPDVVVGIARGGTLPGALIALLLKRDFQSLRVPVPNSKSLPAHLPDRNLIAGRRVLVIDESASGDAPLQWAVGALQQLGAREVRTLVLFASDPITRVDYKGPEVREVVLQPWIKHTLIFSPLRC